MSSPLPNRRLNRRARGRGGRSYLREASSSSSSEGEESSGGWRDDEENTSSHPSESSSSEEEDERDVDFSVEDTPTRKTPKKKILAEDVVSVEDAEGSLLSAPSLAKGKFLDDDAVMAKAPRSPKPSDDDEESSEEEESSDEESKSSDDEEAPITKEDMTFRPPPDSPHYEEDEKNFDRVTGNKQKGLFARLRKQKDVDDDDDSSSKGSSILSGLFGGGRRKQKLADTPDDEEDDDHNQVVMGRKSNGLFGLIFPRKKVRFAKELEQVEEPEDDDVFHTPDRPLKDGKKKNKKKQESNSETPDTAADDFFSPDSKDGGWPDESRLIPFGTHEPIDLGKGEKGEEEESDEDSDDEEKDAEKNDKDGPKPRYVNSTPPGVLILVIGLMAAVITLGVLYGKEKDKTRGGSLIFPEVPTCDDGDALIEFRLTFDSEPDQVGVFLRDSVLRTSLWNFAEGSFRSFSLFSRATTFAACVPSQSTYLFQISDSDNNGLVGSFVNTTTYGSWELLYQGEQVASYHGSCENTEVTECGDYCVCSYTLAAEGGSGTCETTCFGR